MDFLKLRQGCEARDIPIISPNTEKFLIDILKKKKPHNIIEIGSAV
jgi:predicted O-methyltransferase YrrM